MGPSFMKGRSLEKKKKGFHGDHDMNMGLEDTLGSSSSPTTS